MLMASNMTCEKPQHIPYPEWNRREPMDMMFDAPMMEAEMDFAPMERMEKMVNFVDEAEEIDEDEPPMAIDVKEVSDASSLDADNAVYDPEQQRCVPCMERHAETKCQTCTLDECVTCPADNFWNTSE